MAEHEVNNSRSSPQLCVVSSIHWRSLPSTAPSTHVFLFYMDWKYSCPVLSEWLFHISKLSLGKLSRDTELFCIVYDSQGHLWQNMICTFEWHQLKMKLKLKNICINILITILLEKRRNLSFIYLFALTFWLKLLVWLVRLASYANWFYLWMDGSLATYLANFVVIVRA